MLKKIIFSIIVTVTLLLIVEVGLRAYLSIKYKDLQYLKPSLSAIFKYKRPPKIEVKKPSPIIDGKGRRQIGFLQKGFPYTEEMLDFRGRSFTAKKAEGTTRVMVFGGSAVYGARLPDTDETMPSRLESFLGKDYEVINCGYPAYRVRDIYVLLKEEMVNYEPDIILIYAGWNDAFLPVRQNKWLVIHSRLYYRWMLYTALLEFKRKIDRRLSRYSGRIPEDFYGNLQSIINLAKDRGVKVVLVKEPVNLSRVDLLTCAVSRHDSDKELEKKYAGTEDEDSRYLIKLYYYQLQMEMLARENGCILVDPVPMLEDDDSMYIDIVHLNARGANALARLIAERISES